MGSAFQWRRFVYAQAAFVLVLVVGTAGFQAILGEGWVSSFYRTVVTTTLTGLDSQPPGAGAKLFTILLLLGGVAIFLYLAGAIVDLIAHGAISEAYAERKLRRTIDDLHDHAIICGFGRVGRRVAAEFEAIGSSYVVLDHNEEALDAAREHGGLVVHGDGTSDDDLRRAGIVRASALVASADSDESNLFITLSARALRPDLTIVARASVDATARKLRLAGADQVHRRQVLVAPGTRQLAPVQLDSLSGRDFLGLPGHSGVPVDRGAEDIEREDLHAAEPTCRSVFIRIAK